MNRPTKIAIALRVALNTAAVLLFRPGVGLLGELTETADPAYAVPAEVSVHAPLKESTADSGPHPEYRSPEIGFPFYCPPQI